YSGLALSEVAPNSISHDSISRWLNSVHFKPKDLWNMVSSKINLAEPNILICDDTVLEKSRNCTIESVTYQYSGNAHKVIAGIGMINLAWRSLETENLLPVDYRIYDKDIDGKNKNEHFRDMLLLAKQRKLNIDAIVMDAWYSSLENLKLIRNLEWI